MDPSSPVSGNFRRKEKKEMKKYWFVFPLIAIWLISACASTIGYTATPGPGTVVPTEAPVTVVPQFVIGATSTPAAVALPETTYSDFAKTSLYGIFAWVDNDGKLMIAKYDKLEKDTTPTNGIQYAFTERDGLIEFYNASALPENGGQTAVALSLTDMGYLSVTWNDGAHTPLTNKLTADEFQKVISSDEWLEIQMWTAMFETQSICFPLHTDGVTRLEAGQASTCAKPADG